MNSGPARTEIDRGMSSLPLPCLFFCPDNYVRLQVEGHSRTRMGKISRRPIIMHRDMTALDSPEKAAKLPLGPMASRPGPTLLTQVRAALKETAKDCP